MARTSHLTSVPRPNPVNYDGKSHKRTWKLLDKGSNLLSAFVATQVSTVTWRAATGRKPPTSPSNPELRIVEAVTWATLVGATVELSKILVSRRAAQYYVRSYGQLPPGMEDKSVVKAAKADAKATAKDAKDAVRAKAKAASKRR